MMRSEQWALLDMWLILYFILYTIIILKISLTSSVILIPRFPLLRTPQTRREEEEEEAAAIAGRGRSEKACLEVPIGAWKRLGVVHNIVSQMIHYGTRRKRPEEKQWYKRERKKDRKKGRKKTDLRACCYSVVRHQAVD